MNTEKYLPIGTVCMLKNATKRVMITGFAAKGKESGDKVYDYVGCLYPEGIVNSNQNLLFDHEQIDKIFYMGYVDDEQKDLMNKLKAFINGNVSGTNNNSNSANNQTVQQNQNINNVNNVNLPEQQNTNTVPTNDIFSSIPNQS